MNNHISGVTGFAPRSLVFGAQPDSTRFVTPRETTISTSAFTFDEAYPYIQSLDRHLQHLSEASLAFQDTLLEKKLTKVHPQESLPLHT